MQEESELQEYQIQEIQKKFTKNNEVFYYVKWYNCKGGAWIHCQELNATAPQMVSKFQKKLRFKKQLAGYISEKRKVQQKEQKAMIIIESEDQIKPIITISSDSQSEERSYQNLNEPNPQAKDDSQPLEENPKQNHNKMLAVVEDMIPEVKPEAIVDVERFNYLKGVWEKKTVSKDKLLKAAMIRQTFAAYQARLPTMHIVRAVTHEGKKMIRFECKGKLYQAQYDHIRKYRPAQLLEFYEKRKNLFSVKQIESKFSMKV